MSTRVCVKQLPPLATEDKLRELFAEVAPVTDCRIMRRKDGRSRRFAFVGFAQPSHAEAALKMDKVFLGTTRIRVEAAFEYGKKNATPSRAPAAAPGRAGAASAGPQEKEDDEGYGDFRAVMANRNTAATWANDDATTSNATTRRRGAGASAAGSSARAEALGSDDEDEDAAAHAADDGGSSDEEDDNDAEAGRAGDSGDSGEEEEEEDDDMDALVAKAEAKAAAGGGAASSSALAFLQSKRGAGGEEVEEEDGGEGGDDGSSVSSDDSGLDIEGGEIRRRAKRQRPDAAAAEDSDDDLADLRVGGDSDSDDEGADASARAGKRSRPADEEDTVASGRLFVRNLPFTAGDSDLRAHFTTWGKVTEARVALDGTGRSKGFGFVSFEQPACAADALANADLRMFQGRLVHVMAGRAAPKSSADDNDDEGPVHGVSEFQAAKEAERKRQAASGEEAAAWNGLFIRTDAAVKAAAAAAGTTAGEVLDPSASNMAVRVALGETAVIEETKAFLRAQGVDLSALERALAGRKLAVSDRSDTVVLVKNLPHTAAATALRGLFGRFGPLVRVVLPPAKVIALVEYERPADAKRAFKRLAYKRFESAPLYLEWAPTGTVRDDAPSQRDVTAARARSSASGAAEAATSREDAKSDGEDTEDAGAEEAADPSGTATVFVKGLAFATTEGGVEELFATVGAVRAVKIPRKAPAKPGMVGHAMGYGFVEFEDSKHAVAAVKRLQATVLDGRSLDLSLSKSAPRPERTVERRAAKDASGAAPPSRGSTKLLVKNLAFEATRDDLRQLFGAFGKLRSVRVPRKPDGRARGFGFVEFASAADSRTAVQSLASSHLYGRHLVLQWAQDDGSLGAIQSKAARAADKEAAVTGGGARPAAPAPAPIAEETAAEAPRRKRGGKKHKKRE